MLARVLTKNTLQLSQRSVKRIGSYPNASIAKRFYTKKEIHPNMDRVTRNQQKEIPKNIDKVTGSNKNIAESCEKWTKDEIQGAMAFGGAFVGAIGLPIMINWDRTQYSHYTSLRMEEVFFEAGCGMVLGGLAGLFFKPILGVGIVIVPCGLGAYALIRLLEKK